VVIAKSGSVFCSEKLNRADPATLLGRIRKIRQGDLCLLFQRVVVGRAGTESGSGQRAGQSS
jgi:hypothetical protein